MLGGTTICSKIMFFHGIHFKKLNGLKRVIRVETDFKGVNFSFHIDPIFTYF